MLGATVLGAISCKSPGAQNAYRRHFLHQVRRFGLTWRTNPSIWPILELGELQELESRHLAYSYEFFDELQGLMEAGDFVLAAEFIAFLHPTHKCAIG